MQARRFCHRHARKTIVCPRLTRDACDTGGFLQSVWAGYGGIRIEPTQLRVSRPQPLPNSDYLVLHGGGLWRLRGIGNSEPRWTAALSFHSTTRRRFSHAFFFRRSQVPRPKPGSEHYQRRLDCFGLGSVAVCVFCLCPPGRCCAAVPALMQPAPLFSLGGAPLKLVDTDTGKAYSLGSSPITLDAGHSGAISVPN